MQGMVPEFEKFLEREGTSDERRLYNDVCQFLTKTLGRPIDLEAAFTLIDSIVNWDVERLGVSALYHASKALPTGREEKVLAFTAPTQDETRVARALRRKFELFVQRICQIPDGQRDRIDAVYRSLFENVTRFTGQSRSGRDSRHPHHDWPMFTSNYDAILEYYWTDLVGGVQLNTGFQYDSASKMEIATPQRLRNDGLRLFKLHGSVTWLVDERWGLTEQRAPPQDMKRYGGEKFLGEFMLYPIAGMELYMDPYMTMYQMLGDELSRTERSIVVGYSFSDRVVRDIFVRSVKRNHRLILLHPRASEIQTRLVGLAGKTEPIDARFGSEDYESVHSQIDRALRKPVT